MFTNVIGVEQTNDEMVTHRRLDPRPLITAAAFLVLTLTPMIVVMSR